MWINKCPEMSMGWNIGTGVVKEGASGMVGGVGPTTC